MPGAQLQLNSIHGNDSFLTQEPQMSFFTKMYHGYNNYARLTYKQETIHQTKKPITQSNVYTLIFPKNGDLIKYKDLSIKSIKCRNSGFDDDPEITAYIQVKDLTSENNNEVFVFNGWMFSSSPSIKPFDHPVYDIWLVNCY